MSSVSSESNNLAAMLKVERLGTKYGGWFVPLGCIDSSSVCYLAGAGKTSALTLLWLPDRCRDSYHRPYAEGSCALDFIREQIEQDPKVAVYNARFGGGDLNIGGIFKKVPNSIEIQLSLHRSGGEQGTLKF